VMDDARKLLDSLMGSHRNLDRKEAKAKKGHNFKEDHICKHYLIGFCPQHEQLFHSTKRDIGECKKVHSDAMKDEFEAAPDKDKYRIEWEAKLKNYLEELVRGADEWVARERRNIADANRMIEEGGPNEVARAEIKKLNDQSAALLAEAENFAEAGNIQESKSKTDLAADLKRRAQEWEEKSKVQRQDDVCDVCGSRMESGDVNYARFRHQEGKIHLGYVKIREWLINMRKKVRENEEQEERERGARGRRGRGAGGSGGQDRSRSRDRDRRRGGRDRERDRERDRDDRGPVDEKLNNGADVGREGDAATGGDDRGRGRNRGSDRREMEEERGYSRGSFERYGDREAEDRGSRYDRDRDLPDDRGSRRHGSGRDSDYRAEPRTGRGRDRDHDDGVDYDRGRGREYGRDRDRGRDRERSMDGRDGGRNRR